VTTDPTSLDFDRAASYYDQTRRVSPAAQRQMTELLGRELAGRGRCLEIGVGTGRIALPLAAEGLDMAGIDLSRAMLSKLMENAGGSDPFPLAQADATQLPFALESFGAALACHVLHLIPAWEDVLAEIVRVVEPGGVFLNNLGGWRDFMGPWRQIQEHFAAEAGIDLGHLGARKTKVVDRTMERLGARGRRLPEIFDSRESTLAEQINGLAEGLWSFTWQVPEGTRRAAAEETESWARGRFDGLDKPIEVGSEVVWTAYDLA
jgi:SAM-dependent methyltransferase